MEAKKENKKLIIKKDRCLISISNDITLTQRKIYNILLFHTKKELLNHPNKSIFEIELTELENILNIKNNRVFLKKEINDLMDKVIEFDIIDNDDKNKIDSDRSHFISRVKIKNGIVKYEFSSLILEMIDKPQIFTLLELNQINTLNSKFSLALYEFLKDRKTFIPKLTVPDCKKMLVGDIELYSEFRNFRLRVLDVATKEITEKTDLIASYELIKNKNTYTHIKFNSVSKEVKEEIKLENEIKEKLITHLLTISEFANRYQDNELEFYIKDKTLEIRTIEHFKNWMIDNHFDTKIKNILFRNFNVIFEKIILK